MRVLLIVFLLGSLASVAQESAEYRACLDKATTQMAMNTCASAEAARVDARLNDVYHKLLAEAAKQPEAVDKIQGAERAWIAYRDAYVGGDVSGEGQAGRVRFDLLNERESASRKADGAADHRGEGVVGTVQRCGAVVSSAPEMFRFAHHDFGGCL